MKTKEIKTVYPDKIGIYPAASGTITCPDECGDCVFTNVIGNCPYIFL